MPLEGVIRKCQGGLSECVIELSKGVSWLLGGVGHVSTKIWPISHQWDYSLKLPGGCKKVGGVRRCQGVNKRCQCVIRRCQGVRVLKEVGHIPTKQFHTNGIMALWYYGFRVLLEVVRVSSEGVRGLSEAVMVLSQVGHFPTKTWPTFHQWDYGLLETRGKLGHIPTSGKLT